MRSLLERKKCCRCTDLQVQTRKRRLAVPSKVLHICTKSADVETSRDSKLEESERWSSCNFMKSYCCRTRERRYVSCLKHSTTVQNSCVRCIIRRKDIQNFCGVKIPKGRNYKIKGRNRMIMEMQGKVKNSSRSREGSKLGSLPEKSCSC